jgi:hypothetical protein
MELKLEPRSLLLGFDLISSDTGISAGRRWPASVNAIVL